MVTREQGMLARMTFYNVCWWEALRKTTRLTPTTSIWTARNRARTGEYCREPSPSPLLWWICYRQIKVVQPSATQVCKDTKAIQLSEDSQKVGPNLDVSPITTKEAWSTVTLPWFIKNLRRQQNPPPYLGVKASCFWIGTHLLIRIQAEDPNTFANKSPGHHSKIHTKAGPLRGILPSYYSAFTLTTFWWAEFIEFVIRDLTRLINIHMQWSHSPVMNADL